MLQMKKKHNYSNLYGQKFVSIFLEIINNKEMSAKPADWIKIYYDKGQLSDFSLHYMT